MRVLVAEDEYSVRILVADALLRAGHEVIEASNGASACQAIDDLDNIEMIVIDCRVTEASGTFVAQMARLSYPDIPVLFLASRNDRHASRDVCPPYRYLSKPFTLEKLMAVVGGMLH
jgi:two-component system cell cycle sensor histidine kinase/response regulator CckA